MKVIFLDIDGVICTDEEIYQDPAKRKSGELKIEDYMSNVDGDWLLFFSKKAVAALNHITDTTGAKLVISSTWRRSHEPKTLAKHFKQQGVSGEIIGKTPFLVKDKNHLERGFEIQEWLDKNPGVDSFIIIDDDSDMVHLMPRLVKTLWHDYDNTGLESGLTMEKAEEAIRLLEETNV